MNSQIFYFVVIGTIGVSIDYIIYTFILNFLSIDISKTLGFVSGALFNFFMNRKITFSVSDVVERRLLKFFLLYCLTLYLNVTINKVAANFFISNTFNIQIAFILATSVSTVINFIGQKFWVFKK